MPTTQVANSGLVDAAVTESTVTELVRCQEKGLYSHFLQYHTEAKKSNSNQGLFDTSPDLLQTQHKITSPTIFLNKKQETWHLRGA